MNGAVMRSPSFSFRLFDKVRLYKSYNSILNVYLISDIDLFCMKLVSFRLKDMEDLNNIAKRLVRNKVTLNMVKQNFVYLYGSLYTLDVHRLNFIHRYFKK